jgi:hypothetical protein
MHMVLKVRQWGLAVVLVSCSSGPAFAYLDPGTGSILLQGAIGMAAGALVVCKLYWSKLVALISARTGAEPNSDRKDRE